MELVPPLARYSCQTMYLSLSVTSPSPLTLNVIKPITIEPKNQRWNKDRLLAEAYKIHGDKYVYSLPDKITANCKLTITCNKCGTIWSPRLRNHIHNKSGKRSQPGMSRAHLRLS